MIRWFLNIILGKPMAPSCSRECQWEILERCNTFEKRKGEEEARQVAAVFTLRCKTCGDLKDHRSGL